MHNAYFRFYDELNFFLAHRHRNREIEHPFDWQTSIKDMIESLGVPHPEIELILVNSAAVGFSYIVQPGDRITGTLCERYGPNADWPRLSVIMICLSTSDPLSVVCAATACWKQ